MSYTLETTYASIPATTRGKPFVLNGDPKGNNFLYVCGNSVVIRNIADPKISETYDEHQHAPTVAKYSPSGFYICSGDSVGNVRIWDTTQKEHILKAEYRVLGGAIYDLDWSDDSKRIVVCGDGREKYAHAFLMDSGSSVGELSGHIKPVSSITFKQTRPYRVASCGEDFQVNWYEGPPFKFKNKKTGHSRFVNCTRFSPDGNHLASGGSDKLLILYDGKTGEQTKVINAHDGGIYSLSWSPDSTRILTASADRTCKIWDVASGNCVTTFKFENTIENQQLGCLWQGNFLLSVNLAGHITYLNEQDPDHPIRVIKGHNKFVTALDIDRANNKILSGSYDATITRWDIDSGSNENILGKGHGNQVTQFSIDGDNLVSGGMDDTVRITPTNAKEYTATSVKVDAPVVGVSSSKGTIVAATMKSIYVIQGGAIKSNFSPSWDPLSIAINAAGTEVAVGASDNNIYLYTLSGTSLNAKSTLEGHRGGVTSLKYNANGDLASGGKDRNVMVWKNGSLSIGNWLFHAAPVMDVAWSPDGTRVASAAQDQHLIVWNTNEVNKHIQIKGAHRGGANRVAWLNNNTVISAGQDCNVKSWKLNF